MDDGLATVTAHRASFVLRLSRDTARAWHGVIELVGGDRRAAVANEREIGEFIEHALDPAADGEREEERDA